MDPSRRPDTLPQQAAALGRAGLAVAVAAALSNLLSYLVPLIGARILDADNLSAIATLMALLAIASVPGMGLQLAVAVARARHGGISQLGRLTAMAVAASVVPLVALSPVLAGLLRLPLPTVLFAAISTGAVIVASGWMGVLQGAMRFHRLAAAMALQGLARCGGLIAGLLFGLDLIAVAGLGAVIAVIATGAVRPLLPPEPALVTRIPGLAGQVLTAASATIALFVLSYADLLAARRLLPPGGAADYAVLNVLTKGAIWAPQVIAILAVPYFARGVRRSRWTAAAGVCGVGAVLVLASVLFGQFALLLAGGQAYVRLAPSAPAFAGLGAIYALIYVLTSAQVAGNAKLPATPLWLAAAGFTIAVGLLDQPSVRGIVTSAIGAAVFAAIALIAAMWNTIPSTNATEWD